MKTQTTIKTDSRQELVIAQVAGLRGAKASRDLVRIHFEALINTELERLAVIADKQDDAIEAILAGTAS